MLEFAKSFPRGLEPERGVHRPDNVNLKVVSAYLRDRAKPPISIRIRLHMARVSLRAQVRWSCAATRRLSQHKQTASLEPRPAMLTCCCVSDAIPQAKAEVVRYKRAAQRRKLML